MKPIIRFLNMILIPSQVTFQSSKIKFYLCISSQLWLLSYHTVFIPYLELEIQKEFGKRDCRQWFSKSKESITYLEIFEICSWKKILHSLFLKLAIFEMVFLLFFGLSYNFLSNVFEIFSEIFPKSFEKFFAEFFPKFIKFLEFIP